MSAMVVVSEDDWNVDQGLTHRLEYSFDVPANTHHYIGFTTAADPVSISSRGFSTEGTDTAFTLYTGTAYSGGSVVTMKNRNDIYQGNAEKYPFTDCKGNVTAAPVLAEYFASISLKTAGQLDASVGGDTGVRITLMPLRRYVLDMFNNTGTARICSFSALVTRRASFLA